MSRSVTTKIWNLNPRNGRGEEDGQTGSNGDWEEEDAHWRTATQAAVAVLPGEEKTRGP